MTYHQQLIRRKLAHEDNPTRLSEFFRLLAEETPALLGYAGKLTAFCNKHYPAE
jgi:hypothetical protein